MFNLKRAFHALGHMSGPGFYNLSFGSMPGKYRPHQGDQEKARRVRQGGKYGAYREWVGTEYDTAKSIEEISGDYCPYDVYYSATFRAPRRFYGKGRVRL